MRWYASVGLAVGLASACWTGELPERDRRALLTIRDLEAHGVRSMHNAGRESFTRTRYFDGTYNMEYEFEPLHDSSWTALTVIVDVEHNVGDARTDFVLSQKTMVAGLRIAGITVVADSAPTYGDESYFATISKSSHPIGHLVVVRRGIVVYTVMLVGVVFNAADEWPNLLEPKFAFIDSLRVSRR